MAIHRHIGRAGRWAGRALQTLGFWTLWLVLSLLLAAQVYVASTNELEVPAFVLRDLERRLAIGGMRATFGRTLFDPSGRVLMEDVRITIPGFEEPLVTAGAVYAQLDPWALTLERFEPLEVRVTGASLRVPAMFSPSGRDDEIIRGLDAVLRPRGAELDVTSLNFMMGDLAVSARGRLHLGGLQEGHGARLPFPEFVAKNYGALASQFANAISRLAILDHPVLQAEFVPSESHGAVVKATLLAPGLRTAAPFELQATGLWIESSFPISGSGPAKIVVEARADTLRLPGSRTEARGAWARLRAEMPAGRVLPEVGDARLLEATAADLVVEGLDIPAPSASLTPGPWPRLHAELQGKPLGAPLTASADADMQARTATVRLDGKLAPALIDFISARAGRNLRTYANPGSPVAISGSAEFGPAWAFRSASARFSARDVNAWHVQLDEVGGRVEFDGRRLFAPEVFVRFGGNFAQGSYEEDLSTKRYRFLLDGRLRPLDIDPWFPNQDWWRKLFGNFQFPTTPPVANMDWRGRWPTDRETAIFLTVDAADVATRGAAYDRVFGRLFIRPSFDDALEFSVAQGAGAAAGTFARWYDKDAGAMRRLDLDFTSTLDVAPVPRIWPNSPAVLGLFEFERPPAVKLAGRLDWPVGSSEPHLALRLQATADAGFRFHGFSLDRMAFAADISDQDFTLEPLSLGFAGGAATGRVQVRGAGANRRIAIDVALKGASFPRAIGIVQDYASRSPSAIRAIPRDFLKNMASVQLDLTASAEGLFSNPMSYKGGGNATVQGAELTKVPMLGLLSQLLPFTELRFTTARAKFTVDGSRLYFPSIRVTGANSSIDATGTYALDSHALDFNAIVRPLQESKFLPGQFFNMVLAPLSQLVRARLTGTLAKPSWSPVVGPTNFLRSLGSQTGKSASPYPAVPLSPLAHPPAAAEPDPAPAGGPQS